MISDDGRTSAKLKLDPVSWIVERNFNHNHSFLIRTRKKWENKMFELEQSTIVERTLGDSHSLAIRDNKQRECKNIWLEITENNWIRTWWYLFLCNAK